MPDDNSERFAAEPEIPLMDEPFVSLGEAAAGQLRELTLDLWRDLWRDTCPAGPKVTHNLAEAAFMADRVLAISGRPAVIAGDLSLDRPQTRRNRKWIRRVSRQLRKIAENDVISGKTDAL